MIAKKTLTTTGSEYSSYSDFPNPNTTFVKIHLTQAHIIVFNWKAMQLGGFHSPFDRKTTVITQVDRTFLRVGLRENRS